jgi:hypothetical protein
MDGVYRKCYALGCTARHRQGTGILFRFPRNPERYVHKIIEHMWPLIYMRYLWCVHIPYNPFSVPNRVHKLPHTDCCVITECSSMHYNKSCSFFLHCKVFKNDKFRTQFVFNHALSILSVHYWGLHMRDSALYWDCNIHFFLFTVQNCGARESADFAQWRKLGSFTTNFYAEIIPCQQTSWNLKGYAWTHWQFHVAWTCDNSVKWCWPTLGRGTSQSFHEQYYTTITCVVGNKVALLSTG